MDWARMLAYLIGTVDKELLLGSEYLVAENRILKAQLKTPLRLTDADRATLAKIAHRLGRKALEEVANVMRPDTIMGWYRKLVAHKIDGSKREYLDHYNAERNHQSKGNILLFPSTITRSNQCRDPTIHNRERLGGLLRYYYLEAA